MKNLRMIVKISLVVAAFGGVAEPVYAEPNCSQAAALIRDSARQLSVDSDTSKALTAYDKAVELCPTMAEAHYNRGVLLIRLKKYDEGVASLRHAYEAKPQPQFRAALATALLEQGQIDEAREHFEKVLEEDSQSIKSLQGLSVVAQKQGDEDRAVTLLERARAISPQDAVTLFNLAVLKEKKGGVVDAADLYQQVVSIDPKHERAATRLAAIYINQGRPADAERLVNGILEQSPKNLDALKLNAALKSESAEQGKAILSLKRALEVEPKNAQTVVSLATLLLDQNSAEEALRVLKESSVNIPENSAISQLVGQAQMALGNMPEAETAFKRALTLDALDPEAHFNYAVLLDRLGRTSEASEHRETAKKLNPDLPSGE